MLVGKIIDLDQLAPLSVENLERDQQIKASIPTLCHVDYPDVDTAWTVRQIFNRGKSSFVMIEPETKGVGCDICVYLLLCRPGKSLTSLASYTMKEEGAFYLAGKAPNCPPDVPLQLSWSL